MINKLLTFAKREFVDITHNKQVRDILLANRPLAPQVEWILRGSYVVSPKLPPAMPAVSERFFDHVYEPIKFRPL